MPSDAWRETYDAWKCREPDLEPPTWVCTRHGEHGYNDETCEGCEAEDARDVWWTQLLEHVEAMISEEERSC